MSIDDTKFSEAIDKNFDQVVAVFGGKDGVAGKLASQLETYSRPVACWPNGKIRSIPICAK